MILLVIGLLLASSAWCGSGRRTRARSRPTRRRRAYDLLAEGFGAGFNGPIPIVVDVNSDADAPQRSTTASETSRSCVCRRAAVQRREDGRDRVRDSGLCATGRGDRAARRSIARRRRAGGHRRRDAAVYVSGLNAAFIDIADRIYERLPLFLLYIVGVTFIVLAMAFRSIVVSLTAAVATILSAFIGFGVLTLVIQEGYLMELTGLDKTGPIETFVPPIAFAILFGLSMDYMVFLEAASERSTSTA